MLFIFLRTMQESHPMAIDILVTLSKDEYPAVAEFCGKAIEDALTNTSAVKRIRLMEHVGNNFHDILHGLPRILNHIQNYKLKGGVRVRTGNTFLVSVFPVYCTVWLWKANEAFLCPEN
ncbi:hypothetical protein ACJJTC_011450 [Scirpophaga incertulas]